MKIILRERTTGLWLKPSGRWEASSVNAREFAVGDDAIQWLMELHLPNVDVCFVSEGVKTESGAPDPLATSRLEAAARRKHPTSLAPSI